MLDVVLLVGGGIALFGGLGGDDTPEAVRVAVEDAELPELREVVAHEREVVLRIELADPRDPLDPLLVLQRAAERVARVGGIGDEPSGGDDLGDLADEAGLRVVGVDLEYFSHTSW